MLPIHSGLDSCCSNFSVACTSGAARITGALSRTSIGVTVPLFPAIPLYPPTPEVVVDAATTESTAETPCYGDGEGAFSNRQEPIGVSRSDDGRVETPEGTRLPSTTESPELTTMMVGTGAAGSNASAPEHTGRYARKMLAPLRP